MERVELSTHHVRPDRIARVAAAIGRGELVAMPTDTTWAIVGDPFQRKAAQSLQELRARMHGSDGAALKERPMSLMCGTLADVGTYVLMDQPQFRVVRRLLPGPYTIILPASRQVPKLLQTKRRTVGIRMPDHPIAQAVLEAVGHPLLVTTARRLDGELIEASPQIEDELGQWVALVTETEPIVPEESTVVEMEGPQVTVVRAGKGEVEPDWQQ